METEHREKGARTIGRIIFGITIIIVAYVVFKILAEIKT